jgi:hypothetical protein
LLNITIAGSKAIIFSFKSLTSSALTLDQLTFVPSFKVSPYNNSHSSKGKRAFLTLSKHVYANTSGNATNNLFNLATALGACGLKCHMQPMASDQQMAEVLAQ